MPTILYYNAEAPLIPISLLKVSPVPTNTLNSVTETAKFETEPGNFPIKIVPERVLIILTLVITALSTIHIVSQYKLRTFEGPDSLSFIFRVFDMNQEASMPTWFSQSILLAASVLALGIGKALRSQNLKDSAFWYGISAILLYMSIDEGSSIHEAATVPLRDALDLSGTWLHYAWVVAGMGVVLSVVAIFFRFWLRLPARTRWLIFASAAVFVIGSIAFEMLGGYVVSNISSGFKYSVTVALEESFEMAGVSLAIFTLLDYLRSLTGSFSVALPQLKQEF